jgi:predicted SAM-dependent methyltransferase
LHAAFNEYYVQKGPRQLVNLGCGSRFHPAWINIDLVSSDPNVKAHDLTRGIPLPDASCDAVYHSHVLEHIRRGEVKAFLWECLRVLKPGGAVRVVVPDLEKICRLYLEKLELASAGDAQAAADHEWMILEMYDQTVREHWRSPMWRYLYEQPVPNKNFVEQRIGPIPALPAAENRHLLASCKQMARTMARKLISGLSWCKPMRALDIGRFRLSGVIHQWMYDRFSLAQLLREVGFENPVRQSAVESHIPDWPKYNLDTDPDGTVYKPDSLFMEAFKSLKA